MTDWVDLVARARGLATRLLAKDELRSIAGSQDLAGCSMALASAGVLPAPLERASAAELEAGVRRHAGETLTLLARWAGIRLGLLAPLLDDEDRRSIRSMVRGALAGAPPTARLAGLIPTPYLPERALQELARRGDVQEVAAQLGAMSHPYASALAEEAARQHPDLLHLETALNRRFAERAHAATAHGDEAMRGHVAALLDVENLWAVRALPPGAGPAEATGCWVDGGRELRAESFGQAALAPTTAARDAILARCATSPWLRAALADGPGAEDAVLRARIVAAHDQARRQPLGTAIIVELVLRLRAQVRVLQRIVWSLDLGVPRARRLQDAEVVS